jgi:hypothetical protein
LCAKLARCAGLPTFPIPFTDSWPQGKGWCAGVN